MHWSARYIGLPWLEKGATHEGVSCWGLVRLRYAEAHAIALPGYDDEFVCSAERAEVDAVIARATRAKPWNPIPEHEAREDDVVVFRIGGIDAHVGLVIGPGMMLTVSRTTDSHVVLWRSSMWASRLSGFYRHDALMETAHVGG